MCSAQQTLPATIHRPRPVIGAHRWVICPPGTTDRGTSCPMEKREISRRNAQMSQSPRWRPGGEPGRAPAQAAACACPGGPRRVPEQGFAPVRPGRAVACMVEAAGTGGALRAAALRPVKQTYGTFYQGESEPSRRCSARIRFHYVRARRRSGPAIDYFESRCMYVE